MTDIHSLIDEHQNVIARLTDLVPQIERISQEMLKVVANGRTIFWMGNGGSAADAQHMAAELVGRFQHERSAISSIALTTDTSVLTALTNDYDYEIIFSRQIEALCRKGDMVIGISTSGNSKNILNGVQKAKNVGAFTVGLTGFSGGELKEFVDVCLNVNADVTARIQEAHILIGHILCQLLEEKYMEMN